MRRGKSKAIALAVACAFLVAGCGEEQKTVKPPVVKTQQAGAGISSEHTYSGTVHGRYETNLSFQVGGQIIARNIEAGSRVSPGDVLMVIDPKDVAAETSSADAQVSEARAQLTLTEKNLARYRELYAENVIAKATLDQYETAYEAALATYQAALGQAAKGHNSLGYTNLTSGASGVISAVSAEAGQVVAAGQTVATLVQTGELEIEIAIPEDRLAEAAIGSEATVSFWALKATATGVVREVSPMADSASRTYKVRVSLPSPPEGLGLGMTASVSFKGESTGSMTLPLASLYQTGDHPTVWVVVDGKVTQKEIKVLDFAGDSVTVSGLAPTDEVVTAGVQKLSEGDAVRTEGGL